MTALEHCDVLIVGAGPAGMAAAVAAAPSGASIVVIDDNPAPGGQIWRDGQWWADRGYDPVFGRKLPALFERCGLAHIAHEVTADVVRGTSPWGQWWRQTLEVMRATDEALEGRTERLENEYEVLTKPWTDESCWFLTALIHACRGQRLA